MTKLITNIVGLALPLCLLGCASSKPVEKEADSKAAVRTAQELGAEDVPQSALYLELAKQQIATAEKLMKDGEQEQAARFLERAKADAELAIALAKAEDERTIAEDTAKRVEQIQKGI